jgi:K+ transporter
LAITIQRLEQPESLRGLVMIVFADGAAPLETKTSSRVGKGGKTPAHNTQLEEMERKFQQARMEAQTVREEMQTSQEELRSTNEEMQSTNEELTTSKEEMQSLNEELQTVNTELQAKVDELSRSNNDMKNLLNSTDIATLFLDRDLKVRRFTTQATKIIKLILGTLSLVIWTLIIVTTVKYVSFAMRIDNDGEGGILALMSLLGVKLKPRPVIVALGLLGAALIYGDGAVTPAISVLSAVEGLNIVASSFSPYVLPSAVVILVALFFIQSQGTARIGRAFGPIMLTWFVTIALLGIWGIARHPSVLLAINPIYGISYLHSSGVTGFLVLGGVFLCVTGAEALYADMGHFGARPIRLAWSALVFPSLVLNYAGQAALVLEGAPTSDNIFYRLCPSAMLIPLVVLATIATIIASQSIITGAFSMTRQAIQLGWLPRLKVTQTSAEGYGQIYVGAVNWTLMVVTCGLALGFGKSDNLAAAYGIAVSATMLATSALLFIAMREIWGVGRSPGRRHRRRIHYS